MRYLRCSWSIKWFYHKEIREIPAGNELEAGNELDSVLNLVKIALTIIVGV